MLAPATSLLKKAHKRLWMRYALQDAHGGPGGSGFDTAYRLPDPWDMASRREQSRFEATNRLIEREFGELGELLELGCGEGHQSLHLARLCRNHHGVDVSPQAIARARTRLPGGRFEVADIHTQPWGGGRHRFDLVTACEMLYCLPDPSPTIARMRHLARCGLVTFFSPAGRRLQPHLEQVPGLRKDWICFGSTTWLVAWWCDD